MNKPHSLPASSVSTPPANRGVQTSASLFVDWLEYTTLYEQPCTPLLTEYGQHGAWEHLIGVNRRGYPLCFTWNNVELWCKDDRNERHVVASGKGCRDIENLTVHEPNWTWETHLAWLLDEGSRFSRLDIALDVRGIENLIPRIVNHINNGFIISRFNSDQMRHFVPLGVQATGHGTVYLGSPKSDAMIRIYDKRAEQGQPMTAEPWTRIEMQCRRETANAAARALAQFGTRGGLGMLNSYFRITNPDGSRDATWEYLMDWENTSPVRVVRHGGTVESLKNWIETQVAPSLATYQTLHGDAPASLHRLVSEGRKNRTPKLKSTERSAHINMGDEEGE